MLNRVSSLALSIIGSFMLSSGICVTIYNTMQTIAKNDWSLWTLFLIGVPAFVALIGLAILTVVFGDTSYANGWDAGHVAAKAEMSTKVDDKSN